MTSPKERQEYQLEREGKTQMVTKMSNKQLNSLLFEMTSKYTYPLLLIILFLSQFLFISPQGEFALNDDWVHTEIAKHLADTGEFRMSPFAGPTFYLLILYGAGLIKLFGFSFSLLRISTLVFSLATIIIFYFFLDRISKNPQISFWSALALWLNPIFYNLSFTFMTDIPALFFVIASVYAYYVGFEKNNKLLLLLGGMLSICGFFVRQTNILVLIAGGIYALTQLKKNNPVIPAKAGIQQYPERWLGLDSRLRGNDNNTSFKHLLWIFGIPSLIWLIVYYFLASRNLLPPAGADHIIDGAYNLFKHVLWWLWYSIVYVGFFTTPFFIGWSVLNIREFKKLKFTIPFIFALLMTIIIYLFTKEYFPYIPNIINKTGLGPMSSVINGELIPLFSKKIWGVLTMLFAISGTGTIINIFILPKTKLNLFFYILSLLFLLPILFLESFDRYYLPIFIFALIILIHYLSEQKLSKFSFTAALIVYAIFSISQTVFYLSWNSARWDLANSVYNQNTQSYQIDGGYEWNGWNSYWSAKKTGLDFGTLTSPWWIKGLFVNNTEDYIVAFSPIRPYSVIKTKMVPGLNPNNFIYLLKKPN